MEKYGILLDGSSFILGVRYFEPLEVIPVEWIQISKATYEEVITQLKPWSKFINGVIFNGQDEENAYNLAEQIFQLRKEMKEVKNEIELNIYLVESTTELEEELRILVNTYNDLITPP